MPVNGRSNTNGYCVGRPRANCRTGPVADPIPEPSGVPAPVSQGINAMGKNRHMTGKEAKVSDIGIASCGGLAIRPVHFFEQYSDSARVILPVRRSRCARVCAN